MAKPKLISDAPLRGNVEYAAAKRNVMWNKRNGKYATQEEYVEVRNRLTRHGYVEYIKRKSISIMAKINFDKRRFRFRQYNDKGEVQVFEYEALRVGHKAPYEHAEWLWSSLRDGFPSTSQQCRNDQELLNNFAAIAMESDHTDIIE